MAPGRRWRCPARCQLCRAAPGRVAPDRHNARGGLQSDRGRERGARRRGHDLGAGRAPRRPGVPARRAGGAARRVKPTLARARCEAGHRGVRPSGTRRGPCAGHLDRAASRGHRRGRRGLARGERGRRGQRLARVHDSPGFAASSAARQGAPYAERGARLPPATGLRRGDESCASGRGARIAGARPRGGGGSAVRRCRNGRPLARLEATDDRVVATRGPARHHRLEGGPRPHADRPWQAEQDVSRRHGPQLDCRQVAGRRRRDARRALPDHGAQGQRRHDLSQGAVARLSKRRRSGQVHARTA